MRSEGPPLEDSDAVVAIITAPLVIDITGISPGNYSILHTPELMGAFPISIVEAVHGRCTRVLTIPIAVELQDKYS
jgi:hypothetical protein